MTKKFTLKFFIVIYLVSLIAGFGFAGISQANAITQTSTMPRQSAWILVRVDDMTIEQPDLISVWAMFLTFSPNPQVFFKPLFSNDASDQKNPNLGTVFGVSSDRTVSLEFIQELDRLISHQSGMVIVDNTGFEGFTSWFTPPTTAGEIRPFVPHTGSANTFGGETRQYYQICETLEASSHPSLVSLPWKNLLPNHLLAYPSMLSLTKVWEQLYISDIETHCEVIPNL